jgi:hypothetical protein
VYLSWALLTTFNAIVTCWGSHNTSKGVVYPNPLGERERERDSGWGRMGISWPQLRSRGVKSYK